MDYSLDNARGLLGVFAAMAVCWALSENKLKFPFGLAAACLALQATLVVALFAAPNAQAILGAMSGVISGLARATREGTQFVFGYLGGGEQPFPIANEGRLFVFAFEVLPLILVISALSALLWYFKILKVITTALGLVFQRLMGLSGPAALAVAANIFMGMMEAPIVIRGYLTRMPRSELFLLMCVGLSTVAGSTMVAYAAILSGTLENAAGHVVVASIISAPAGVLLARIIMPASPQTSETAEKTGSGLKYAGPMDALSQGVKSGLEVSFNIAATLIVFVALVALTNQVLSLAPHWGGEAITLQRMFGLLFAPLAWLIGIPLEDVSKAGWLLGVKLFLTEFVAFLELGAIPAGEMSERARMLLTYALCGFANIGSVGILVAGMTTLLPERREEIIPLAMRALVPGFLATCISAGLVSALPMQLFGG